MIVLAIILSLILGIGIGVIWIFASLVICSDDKFIQLFTLILSKRNCKEFNISLITENKEEINA